MADHAQGVYMGIHIQGPLEEVGRFTRTPELHERRDVRFMRITTRSVPRPDPARVRAEDRRRGRAADRP